MKDYGIGGAETLVVWITQESLNSWWPAYCSWYSNWLWAGRSGDQIPVGSEISAPVQIGPPHLLYNGYRVFPGVKSCWGVTLTHHPLLVPWSRKSRAIPLLPLWGIQPLQSLGACTRVHFTLLYSIHELNWVMESDSKNWILKLAVFNSPNT